MPHLDITTSLHHHGNMRTTVNLDEDIYEAATRMAEVSGERFGKVLSELARRGLNPPLVLAKTSKQKFPTFPVPPGTPPISSQQVEDFVDEEGSF